MMAVLLDAAWVVVAAVAVSGLLTGARSVGLDVPTWLWAVAAVGAGVVLALRRAT